MAVPTHPIDILRIVAGGHVASLHFMGGVSFAHLSTSFTHSRFGLAAELLIEALDGSSSLLVGAVVLQGLR